MSAPVFERKYRVIDYTPPTAVQLALDKTLEQYMQEHVAVDSAADVEVCSQHENSEHCRAFTFIVLTEEKTRFGGTFGHLSFLGQARACIHEVKRSCFPGVHHLLLHAFTFLR
jgi:hypothetical protein